MSLLAEVRYGASWSGCSSALLEWRFIPTRSRSDARAAAALQKKTAIYDLEGSIPPELGLLSSEHLRALMLSVNNLIGSIPSVLGNLAKLTKLRFLSIVLSRGTHSQTPPMSRRGCIRTCT